MLKCVKLFECCCFNFLVFLDAVVCGAVELYYIILGGVSNILH